MIADESDPTVGVVGGCFRDEDELSWSSHLQITQLRIIEKNWIRSIDICNAMGYSLFG